MSRGLLARARPVGGLLEVKVGVDLGHVVDEVDERVVVHRPSQRLALPVFST